MSLPDPMKAFVEELVTQGDYSSASEYVRALIREDRKRREKEKAERPSTVDGKKASGSR